MKTERDILRTGEALVADLTDVGFLASVRTDVADEVVRTIIMAPAESALEVAAVLRLCG
jgi:hypothetical protein